MNLLNLISKGYFPKELPPPFTTKYFADYFVPRSAHIAVHGSSVGLKFSIPKFDLSRISVVITNPMHQSALSKLIIQNWTQIESELNKTLTSFSSPTTQGERAANTKSFKEFTNACFKDSYFHKYQLKFDISKYYNSIYTHSIAWAIHTKQFAKANRGPNILGNDLDRHVRNTQDNQTIGIPIGPDTSLIISEIIGASIDSSLFNRIPNLVGYRFIDDMYYYFNSFAEAEYCLKELLSILSEFELNTNFSKTKIQTLPIGSEKEWVIKIRKFEFRDDTAPKQINDLVDYFSMAFELLKENSEDPVLNFAIATISSKYIYQENFDFFESMLYKSIQTETTTLKIVLPILLKYRRWVKKKKLKRVIFNLINDGVPRGYDYEVSWALWYAKTFEIKLTKPITKVISGLTNPVSILIALDLLNSNLLSTSHLNQTNWQNMITRDALWDERWLLAYEISVKGWLMPNYNYITRQQINSFFRDLKNNDVIFYDNNLQLTPSKSEPKPKSISARKTYENLTDKITKLEKKNLNILDNIINEYELPDGINEIVKDEIFKEFKTSKFIDKSVVEQHINIILDDLLEDKEKSILEY